MSGKYLEFVNVLTGEMVFTKTALTKRLRITKHMLEKLMAKRKNGVVLIYGEEWKFSMKYQHLGKRDYVPNPKGRKTDRPYTFNKVNAPKPLEPGDRVNKPAMAEDKLYYYETYGNLLCQYSTQSKRLVSTSWTQKGNQEMVKGMMPKPGDTTIIDKILSGEIFVNMKISNI